MGGGEVAFYLEEPPPAYYCLLKNHIDSNFASYYRHSAVVFKSATRSDLCQHQKSEERNIFDRFTFRNQKSSPSFNIKIPGSISDSTKERPYGMAWFTLNLISRVSCSGGAWMFGERVVGTGVVLII
ncbi:hypothetical protein AVEN_40333-1 [Araneus ventricosus]|uniref:Uncharacterized protein n=1 Tax=Araneus ventricosus TaxID=182803 RepID=A0A4Y2F453_ARAVE|nr:hypothetical protein AVEN_40333-1 [Araneus ventricosus]